MLLYPQNNRHRQYVDLSGFWDFRFAEDGEDFSNGLTPQHRIAVPASWNELFTDQLDNLGPAWYQTRFVAPWGWEHRRVSLRFNSVNYLASVWLNGALLGDHEGGHLPFVFDLTGVLDMQGDNLLVVRVDGRLSPDHIPPGNLPPDSPRDTFANNAQYPNASFDFFPYCGIQRPVLLYATPQEHLEDITVVTDIRQRAGIVTVEVSVRSPLDCTAHLTGHGFEGSSRSRFARESAVHRS
jgi:beta-glucuronidase